MNQFEQQGTLVSAVAAAEQNKLGQAVVMIEYLDPPRRGGLRPWPNQDPIADAKAIRKAIRGFGTNDRALIQTIVTRTFEQRQAIAMAYNVGAGVAGHIPQRNFFI
jgi:hypothetical protein